MPDDELYQVFNMGIGMVTIVSADKADAVLKFIHAQKHKAWIIGEVVKGRAKPGWFSDSCEARLRRSNRKSSILNRK